MSKTETIAIFGSTSEIGTEIARREAPGNSIILLSRRPEDQNELEAELLRLGARECTRVHFDATEFSTHSQIIEWLRTSATISRAYLMFGVLGNQELAEHDPREVQKILTTDFTAQASVITALVSTLRAQSEAATVVAFSSIAGNRVRRANYVYGSAKYGLDGFCQGMQDSLSDSSVRLLLVRPGFVIGTMTKGMDPAPLARTASQVAEATLKAVRGRRDTVWVPWGLGILAGLMRLTPSFIWKRLSR